MWSSSLPSSSFPLTDAYVVPLLVLSVYLHSRFPSVPGGDAGELLAEACHSGVAHPPGYPLFLLCVRGVIKIVDLTVGLSSEEVSSSSRGLMLSPALAANYLSCLFGGVSSLLVSLSVRRWSSSCNLFSSTVSDLQAGFAALLFGLSPLTWEYSIGVEVFAMNNMLVAATIYLTTRIVLPDCTTTRDSSSSSSKVGGASSGEANSRRKRDACLGSLLCGLCLSNQHTSLLFLLFLVPFVFAELFVKTTKARTSSSSSSRSASASSLLVPLPPLPFAHLLPMSLALLIGLSPYLYLVVSSSSSVKAGSWGETSSVSGLWRHVSRSEYGTLSLAADRSIASKGSESFVQRIAIYCVDLQTQISLLGVACAISGTAITIIQARRHLMDYRKGHCCEAAEETKSKKKKEKRTNDNWKEIRDETRDDGTKGAKQATTKPTNKTKPPPPPPPTTKAQTAGICDPAAGGGAAVDGKLARAPRLAGAASSSGTEDDDSPGGGYDCGTTARDEAGFARLSCVFALTFVGYNVIWNGVFSNLPLSVPMAYNVHSRFWMQPNMLVCMFAGLGFGHLLTLLSSSLRLGPRSSSVLGRALLYLCLLLSVRTRLPLMSRRDASAIAAHGLGILDSVPDGALLMSHTDLDWNAVRYFRVCEGIKREVVHVSAQIMPYPWFQRQVSAGVYGREVKFPAILDGVSTNRYAEGNALLISRFFEVNFKAFEKKGMYVDMQAINDEEIEGGGRWRQFTLIPNGLVYRVVRREDDVQRTRRYHHGSSTALQRLQNEYQFLPASKYAKGSWEFAAGSVYQDAHYQYALFFLTYAIEIEKTVAKGGNMDLFREYVSTLDLSAEVLYQIALKYQGGSFSSSSVKEGHLSYPEADMMKNAALANMKSFRATEIFLSSYQSAGATGATQGAETQSVVELFERAKARCGKVVESFVRLFPTDESAPVFGQFLTQNNLQ